jgi:hypothetical protein
VGTVRRATVLARVLLGGAVCLYVVACILPVAVKTSFGSGNPTGTYLGIEVLLLGWITILGQPLLFIAWISNVSWLVALIGRLKRGSVRWVRRCITISLVCAAPAVLPIWPAQHFGDLHGRYWWFASYVLLAIACRTQPQSSPT